MGKIVNKGKKRVFTNRISLNERDLLGGGLVLVEESSHLVAGQQGEGDLGLHISELLLDQLECSQRYSELLSLKSVVSGVVEAELSRSDGAPGDTVSGFIEAGEGYLESLVLLGGELVGDWDLDVVHDDHAGGAGSQRELSLDLGCGEAGHALLEDEASDIVGLVLRPDDEHVRDGGVRDPGLGAVQHEVVALSLGG